MSTHTIVSGDTFWALSKKYGCTLDAILAANPGIIPEQLQIGQIIRLPDSGIYLLVIFIVLILL
jgi:LysM repeat protein